MDYCFKWPKNGIRPMPQSCPEKGMYNHQPQQTTLDEHDFYRIINKSNACLSIVTCVAIPNRILKPQAMCVCVTFLPTLVLENSAE